VPTKDKLFLSFNMYFLVFYDIHNHEFLELSTIIIVVQSVVKSVPYSLFLFDIITFNFAFNFMHFNSQTINLFFLIRLNFVL
jgi:hypothetical protein